MQKRLSQPIGETLDVTTLAGARHTILYTGAPDTCPLCHTAIVPHRVGATGFRDAPAHRRLQIVFQCPRRDCEQLFIGTYLPRQLSASEGGTTRYALAGTAPWTARQEQFSDLIRKVSPKFQSICNQPIAAEAAKLTEICGMGYRKALEFLVKDFAISQSPDRADDIRAMTLGDCIKNEIADPNVKRCAERAAWLGNDETHYTRLFADRDIVDLKRLILTIKNWIENVLQTQHYVDGMQSQKRPRTTRQKP